MLRLSLLPILLALTSPVLAQAKAGTNEWLFELCKAGELWDTSKKDLTAKQIVEAASCRHYMVGAFQMYNYKTAKQCDLTGQSPDSLTKLFMGYVREHGQLAQESWVTIGSLMDNCFCSEDLEFAKLICPASSK